MDQGPDLDLQELERRPSDCRVTLEISAFPSCVLCCRAGPHVCRPALVARIPDSHEPVFWPVFGERVEDQIAFDGLAQDVMHHLFEFVVLLKVAWHKFRQ